MSMWFMLSLIAVGLIAILVLSRVIFIQLKKERVRQQDVLAARDAQIKARANIIESILILLKTVGSEELGWIETSIRIKHLLDQLSLDLSTHQSISVFYKVFSETEHIPTHDAWQALPQSAKRSFRNTFVECETKYLTQLQQAKEDLLAYPFSTN